MAKKTVVRRASKKWPLDAELADALNDADSVVVQPARPQFAMPEIEQSQVSEAGKEALMPSDPPVAATDEPPMAGATPLAEKKAPKKEKEKPAAAATTAPTHHRRPGLSARS